MPQANNAAWLERLSTYGGAALLEVPDAEMDLGSEVRDAAIALHRYKAAAEAFAKTKAEIEVNTRFSAEGRKALETNASLHKAHLAIAIAALAGGNVDEARSAYENARGAGPRGSSLSSCGSMFMQGRTQDATLLWH